MAHLILAGSSVYRAYWTCDHKYIVCADTTQSASRSDAEQCGRWKPSEGPVCFPWACGIEMAAVCSPCGGGRQAGFQGEVLLRMADGWTLLQNPDVARKREREREREKERERALPLGLGWGGIHSQKRQIKDREAAQTQGGPRVGDLICEVVNMTITIAFKEADNYTLDFKAPFST